MFRAIFIAILSLLSAACSTDEGFSVVQIDVGYGTCVLVYEHGGSAVLLDGGFAEEIDAVETALITAGVDSLAMMVCTHGHGDHLEGITLLLERNWSTGQVAGNAPFGHESYDSRFWSIMRDRNIPYRHLRAGHDLTVDSFHIAVLHPESLTSNLNESSLAISMTVGQAVMLNPSDIDPSTQEHLIGRFGSRLRADMLLLPHHGDRLHPQFLNAVSPSWGLLSVGPNPWELPLETTLGELDRRNIRLIDTRTLGTTRLSIRNRDIRIVESRGPSETTRREADMDTRIRRWTGAR